MGISKNDKFYTVGKNKMRNGAYWERGMPLTDQDRELLAVLVEMYGQLGYVPTKGEVPNANDIKGRFRIWSDALYAAGLPRSNDPEQMRRRQQAKKLQEPDKEK